MPIKFNPQTGRYERYTEGQGYEPIGPAGSVPAPIPTTTVPSGASGSGSKRRSGSTPTRSRGDGAGTPPRRSGAVPPTIPTPPAQGGTAGPGLPPNLTIPAPTTTTPSGTPVPATSQAGKNVGAGFHGGDAQRAGYNKVMQAKMDAAEVTRNVNANQFDGMTLEEILAYLNGSAGGGAASKAASGRAAYTAGMQAASQQEAAATQAQNLYDQLAGTTYSAAMSDITNRYNPQFDAIKKYYAAQGEQAKGAITGATTAALAALTDPTAYQNLMAPFIGAPKQGLDLGMYGVSPEAAQKQAETDAATAKFISDMMTRGYAQTQAVNKDYMTALRNAVTAEGAQGQNALTAQLAGLQAQETGGVRTAMTQEQQNAAAARDALIKAGLDALISGKQTAAATRAETTKSYGQYKPKKGKGKKPSA